MTTKLKLMQLPKLLLMLVPERDVIPASNAKRPPMLQPEPTKKCQRMLKLSGLPRTKASNAAVAYANAKQLLILRPNKRKTPKLLQMLPSELLPMQTPKPIPTQMMFWQQPPRETTLPQPILEPILLTLLTTKIVRTTNKKQTQKPKWMEMPK